MKKSNNTNIYQHQIASRKELLDLLSLSKKPLSFADIIKKLNYQQNIGQQNGLKKRLNAMMRDGQLLQNRKKHFGVSAKMDLVVGIVQGNSEGFGFLITEDSSKDLFIHFRQMSMVMHGDKVLAQKVEFKGKLEAKIIEVLEHANKTLVTRFVSEIGINIGIPVNPRIKHEIIIPADLVNKANNNDMVLLKIIKHPNKRFQPIGEVVEVLGGHLDPGMEIDVAMHAFGIPHLWSNDVLDFAGKIPAEIKPDDFKNRQDLTHIPFVTIDGADSKDFDDAVWCESNKNGWRVLVAIADVSHYVPVDSILDIEAQNRATSVYFPEFVVPMLPESLSNGICSLNPNVDRCAMICEIFINQQGDTTNYHFFKAIIKSHARLTYDQVGGIFEKTLNSTTQKLLKDLPFLNGLIQLYYVLAKKRQERGALDFETIETKIHFNEDKKISAIVPVFRNNAHKLIEELMVAANVCAGKFISKYKIPGLFRIHEAPKEEKIQNLQEFLKEFGLVLQIHDKPEPKDYAQILQQAKKKPEFDLIQTVCLRSMNQAIYSPNNLGHFGLAHEVYAHFTSPIRRYPDLLIHRAIQYILEISDKKSKQQPAKIENYIYTKEKMMQLAMVCSTAERRADDATRDVEGWLKCEYMQDKVGEIFSGVVASVTNFGLFIRLDNIFIDGLLHISLLEDGYYHFDAVRHRLESENQSYGIGDKLQVLVAKVNLDERKIDFTLPDNDNSLSHKTNKKFNKIKR